MLSLLMAGWTPCCRETGLGRAGGCGAGLGTGMVERQLSHHRDQLAGRGGRQRRAGRAGVLTSFRRDRGQGLVGGGWGPFGLRLRCRAVTPVCGRAMGGADANFSAHFPFSFTFSKCR